MLKKIVIILIVLNSYKSFAEINKSHAIAMHGSPKYKEDFSNVEYVNPNSPKGGDIRLDAFGSFDSFNAFISKGEQAAGLSYLFETLTSLT